MEGNSAMGGGSGGRRSQLLAFLFQSHYDGIKVCLFWLLTANTAPLCHHSGAGPGLPLQPPMSPQGCWPWAANTAAYINTGVLGLGCQYSPHITTGVLGLGCQYSPHITTGVLGLGCYNSPLYQHRGAEPGLPI